MPQEATLNEREQLILQAVVQSYITTAEPVGSRAIVKRFGLELSPATVRNVMADLEEGGYLEQLHTSSGRVPTDQGYRYYVNHLMQVQELTLAERERIERELSSRLNDADQILQQTSQLLALVTHQAGLVKAPDEGSASVRYIEVVPVSSNRAAVLVADNYGRAHTVMVPLREDLERACLGDLNRYLNQSLRGASLEGLSGVMRERMRLHLNEDRMLAERALHVLDQFPSDRPARLYLEGTAALFEQPEFRDVDRAREVFGLFEERDGLVHVLRSRLAEGAGLSPVVLIGSESREPRFKEMSFVASQYSVGDKPAGVLGIIGPRRMPYSRLTAIVDYTANMVSRFLTRLAG